MGSSSREQRQNIDALTDPFARNSLRLAYHIRKYAVLYVCGALGAVALALFPTYAGNGNGGTQTVAGGPGVYGGSGQANAAGGAGAAGATAATGPGASAAGATAGATPGAAGAAGATAAGGGAGSAAGAGGAHSVAAQGGSGQIMLGSGTTRGGYPCKPGVRQLPYSVYAAPCIGKFSGNNGGKTYNGVTGSTITIAVRHTSDSTGANAQATQAENQAAGGVDYKTNEGYVQKLVGYFNQTFELYGRQVKLVDVQGQGNYTNEELDQGQQAACADADQIANSTHAFATIDYEGIFEWGPYAECAARYKMWTPQAAPYFPETYYQKYSPYMYSTIMNCNLIAQEVAEFVGKQLAPYPSKWAGMDGATSLNGKKRKFGTYVPNNPEYQECVTQTNSIMQSQYHVSKSQQDQYNYQLDISQFPNDAQRAAVQFAANKDTTVVLACDPISPIFLTKDAANQNYHPEWMLIGVAYTDSDNWAQLWDQTEVTNHLFGLSQAASTSQLLNPKSEAGIALQKSGLPVNISSVSDYYELISIFNQLQAAGPDLTPANIGGATPHLPISGSGAWGTWYFGNTHTAVIDSREIYWNASGTSQGNHRRGTYVPIYGDKRFRLGGFPSGQPPFFG